MHVLVIPSEEFQPQGNHLAGIFQKHQIKALQAEGITVRTLSIKQSLSVLMLLKALLLRLIGRKPANSLQHETWLGMWSLLFNKLFNQVKFVSFDSVDGIDVVRIDGFYYYPPSIHTNHIGWIKAGKVAYREYVKKFGRPDLIHAHNVAYAGILASELLKSKGVKYAITEHSSYIARDLESPKTKPAIANAYENASSFFVVSAFLGECIDRVYKRKFNWTELPNVLDNEVESAPIRERLTGETIHIVAIGSLIPLKRHSHLIEAFQQTHSSLNARLTIAGDGELKNSLIRLINEKNLKDRVTLLDRQNRPQIIELLDNADVFVLCSEIETFGVVVIEALSRGVPVLATRCGGPNTLINEGNGVLVEADNIEALVAGLNKIVSKLATFNRMNIRAEAIEKYGNKGFANKLIDSYKKEVL